MQQFLPGCLLTLSQVSTGMGVEQRTVRRWVKEKKFPQPISLNGQIRWRSDQILEWVIEQQVIQRLEESGVCPPQPDFARTTGEETKKEASQKPKRD